MLAYMNREAFRRTLKTGYTWFYSRSRKTLWNKGETSGHVQKWSVSSPTATTTPCFCGSNRQALPAHRQPQLLLPQITGRGFAERGMTHGYAQRTVPDREARRHQQEGSYTCYLFQQGLIRS